jgi:hypothetical protein
MKLNTDRYLTRQQPKRTVSRLLKAMGPGASRLLRAFNNDVQVLWALTFCLPGSISKLRLSKIKKRTHFTLEENSTGKVFPKKIRANLIR